MNRSIPLVLLALAVASPRLSIPANSQTAAALSDSSTISLVTVLPGEQLYSLFGHSAIRVSDPEQDLDLSYSYGTFHFDDPLFVVKFAMGHLDYYLSIAYFRRALELYRDVEGRPVIEQRLDLTLAERNELYRFLQQNALPENRYYRYDFLFDNCSTRIRAALERVFGNRLRFEDERAPEATFRQLLEPYLLDRPFLELGIDVLLGRSTDRIATASEATFLPDFLSLSFDEAWISDEWAIERKLVSSRDTLVWEPGYRRAERGPPWDAIVFAVVALVIILATAWELKTGRPREMVDVTLFGSVGLAGCFLLFMWFGTAHHVTAANWNLAWAWPTHLIYAAVRSRTELGRFAGMYALLTASVTVMVIALWNVLPQHLNGTFLAVAVVLVVRSVWTYAFYRQKKAGRAGARPASPATQS